MLHAHPMLPLVLLCVTWTGIASVLLTFWCCWILSSQSVELFILLRYLLVVYCVIIAHSLLVYCVVLVTTANWWTVIVQFRRVFATVQGDHLSGKPGNVREFETCQGSVRDFVNSQGNVREKLLSWKSVPKLFITSWIFAFIWVISSIQLVLVLATCSLNISISFKNRA